MIFTVVELNIEQIQRFYYFTSRIWWLDLCFHKSYNVVIYYSIVTYCIICMYWKWSHIMSKNCNCISWNRISFYCGKKSFCSRRTSFIFQSYIFIYLYCRFYKFPYTIKIIIRFYPTERNIWLSCCKWFLFSQIKINNTLF